MTYDPNNPNDIPRSLDPNARRLDNDPRLNHSEPVKKQGSPVAWLALLGLLIVAGLVWMQVGSAPNNATTNNAPASSTTEPSTPAPATAPAETNSAATPPPAATTPPPATDAPAPTNGTTTQP